MRNAFFHLLRHSLHPKKGFFTDRLAPEEWNTMYRMAKEHAIIGILFSGIEHLPAELRPPKDIILRWFSATEKIRKTNQLLDARAVEITNYFRKEGFESCILKGQGLARLYPTTQLRTPGDIDIWIAGKRNDILSHCQKVCPSFEVRYHHMHFPFFQDVEVEVHFTPSWMNYPIDNYRLQHYFKAECHKQMSHALIPFIETGNISVPTAEFNRIYILLHIYRHFLGEGIGLRQLIDYYYVLQQGFTDYERLNTIYWLQKLHMVRFAAAVMHIMKEVFELDENFLLLKPNSKVGTLLINEVMMAGNFGKYDKRIDRYRQDSALHRFVSSIRRNEHFLHHYPLEVLYDAPFKLWLYGWRKLKGYK